MLRRVLFRCASTSSRFSYNQFQLCKNADGVMPRAVMLKDGMTLRVIANVLIPNALCLDVECINGNCVKNKSLNVKCF
jgi:hypothetical protein